LALVANAGGTLYFTSAGVSVFIASGVAAGSSTKIGQVVSTTLTTTFTMSSQTYATVTGLTATITPTLNTSKILVVASLSATGDNGISRSTAQLVRDSTAIAIATSASSRVAGTSPLPIASNNEIFSTILLFLDSPATTSALVYGVQVRSNDPAATTYVNRSKTDSDNVSFTRAVSTITVMEVLA
jgi:hypothetical protein